MPKTPRFGQLSFRCRKPLPACIASLFALASPTSAFATTWTVDTCDEDSHSTPGVNHGTLRYALLNAGDNDTIEMAGLSGVCSKITLTTGSLSVAPAASNLTLHGPGSQSLAIDASTLPRPPLSVSRVLSHYGTGKLTIDGLKLEGGYVNYNFSPAYGGCLYSTGNVYLKNSSVTSCTAYGRYDTGRGGGVFASGYVRLTGSTVTGSSALGQSGTVMGGAIYSGSNVYLSSSQVAGSVARSGTVATPGHPAVAGGAAYGGGIFAKGKLGTVSSFITGNIAYSTGAGAYGGGALVGGDTTLVLSAVSGNELFPGTGKNGKGGGVQAENNFYSNYTTITNNRAFGTSFGGGLFLRGPLVTIKATTISANTSGNAGGGVELFYGIGLALGSASLVMANSTISGNSATNQFGGIYTDAATAKIYNSTIAFNTAATSRPGAVIGTGLHGVALTLGNTIMSNNTVGPTEDDLDETSPFSVTVNGGSPGFNGYNLVRVASPPIVLPTDTKNSCPHLGRLRDNGGPTQTHALLSNSPAIDTGINAAGGPYDQRGPLAVNGQRNYVRPSGPTVGTPKSDIGAYEVQQDEIVLGADFEDCPGLPF